MFWKSQDRTIDNLLRAHAAGRRGPISKCLEFDPDQATAYIEHALSVTERLGYEKHLSLCPSCRRSVTALTRLYEPRSLPSLAGASEGGRGWREGLRSIFTTPQWAVAAAAVVLLVISIPLLISRKNIPTDQAPAEAQGSSAAAIQQPSKDGQAVAVAQTDNQPDRGAAQGLEHLVAKVKAATAQNEQENRVAQQKRAAGDAVARMEPPQVQKVEAQHSAAKADEVALGEISASAAAAPPAPEAEEKDAKAKDAETKELAKIDPADATRLPKEGENTLKMSVLKPGRPDGSQRAGQEATIRPEVSLIPPKSPPSDFSRNRRLAESTARHALRDSSSDEAARRASAERRAGNKKFYLLSDTWVDKDYNQNKKLPEVPIIRDSDVYKEVLLKHNGLRAYFGRFAEGERAIIVYKGTVYRLIPQGSSK